MRLPSCRMLAEFKLASSAGAIAAVLALAGTAWTGEGPKNDEVFILKRAVPIPGIPPGTALVSFDISWFDADPSLNKYYLADRSNKAVDVIHSGSSTVTHQFTPGFVGARSTCVDNSTTPPTNTGTLCSAASPCSGAQVCRATMTFPDPTGCSPSTTRELWVGDGDSRVWVLDPTTGAEGAVPPGAPNPIPTESIQFTIKEPMSSASIQLIIS